MSLNPDASTQPTGARRMSMAMLEVRDRADQFAGASAGTAKPLTYLAAFQEAEPYLGLPAHAYKLVAWLVKQTMPCDWETGSRPIAWPSARRQQEQLGLSPARVKMLNRTLFEAGIFVIRDNEQGKRYGRRGPDKRIIEAYGFDLTPLAQRYDEFIRIAAAAKTERGRVKDMRRRITIARRGIRQIGELLAGLGAPLPAGWAQLQAETAELIAVARRQERSEELGDIAKALESRQAQAEQWVREESKPVDTNPVGLVCEPHTTTTNLESDLTDTVMASEESSRAERAAPQPAKPLPQRSERGVAGIRRASQLLELFPRLEQYVVSSDPDWPTIVDAAGGALRHDLGISSALWVEACRVLGREGAALAVAIVSSKAEGHFTRGPGGYLGGMLRKAEKGELYLEKTLWALREVKWGKGSRRLN